MKFKLKLKPHEVGNLMNIVRVQINDEGKVLNETKVGYIESSCANQLNFKELTDWGRGSNWK